ncbi:MAG: short-chain dehydrogenase/reductase [Frankiales bacterium]|nr:short-chain dehydrogenase/reductase [Frankiales bacterium]
MPLHAPHAASAFALRAFSDALRAEPADERSPVAVTSILPASIGTPYFEHSRSTTGSMPEAPPLRAQEPGIRISSVCRASRYSTPRPVSAMPCSRAMRATWPSHSGTGTRTQSSRA